MYYLGGRETQHDPSKQTSKTAQKKGCTYYWQKRKESHRFAPSREGRVRLYIGLTSITLKIAKEGLFTPYLKIL